MVELLLNTIYAVWAGSWDLLLECARDMIPYCFAYNNVNYARFLANFLGDMLALKNDFPEVYQPFQTVILQHSLPIPTVSAGVKLRKLLK